MLGLTTGKVLASPQPRSPQRRPRRGHRRVLELNAGDGGGLDGVDADVAPLDVLLGAAAAREVPADERDIERHGRPVDGDQSERRVDKVAAMDGVVEELRSRDVEALEVKYAVIACSLDGRLPVEEPGARGQRQQASYRRRGRARFPWDRGY